ncbi:MAG: PepSY-associated TM helix domain-containing protein [Ginsengibacter sp.]
MDKKRTTWQKVRNIFQNIHLWIGLSTGIIVVIICLSGTLYVYNTELTEMASPHLYKVEQEAKGVRMTPDAAIKKVKTQAEGEVIAIHIPEDLNRTYQINVKKEGDKSRNGTTYYLNPYTGDILGNSLTKSGMQEFMSTLFSLHRWLLFDKIETSIFSSITNQELGRKITGTATILFTLGCITGMIIWFPKRIKNWKKGLKIKATGNWKRTNHDLHNTLAFYSVFFLLIMGLTGPQWSFTWYKDGLHKTLGTYKKPEVKNSSTNKEILANIDSDLTKLDEINLASLLKLADTELLYKGDYKISLPAKGESLIEINKTKTGFFAPAAGDKLSVDVSDQKIVKKEIFKEKPFNERIAGSIKALHMGYVYGGASKLIYFITCLIATSLPITGTMIWWNKKKKKKPSMVGVKKEKAMVA